MIRLLAAGLLALAAADCAPSSLYHGDPAFAPDDRAVIEIAARTMALRTGGEEIAIVWDGGGDGDDRILRQVPPDAGEAEGAYYSPRSDRTGGARLLYLSPELHGHALRKLAAHEIGHHYGLAHLEPGESGVMASPTHDEWTEADVRECRRVGLCGA